jgi:two-component system, chemotaxis family, chemotaxis protein CheY
MKRKILVVDDSATVRDQVGLALASEASFEIIQAADGAAGVQQLERHPDTALVISDVNMPKLNGIEMAKAIKATGKHVGMPIVMLTTEGRADLIAEAKQAGAKAWIVKPFKPELLLAAVRKLTGC